MLGVVLTTVHVADVLVGYAENFRHFRHSDVFFVVVADRETCVKSNLRVAETIRGLGFPCYFLSVEKQLEWLRDYPELDLMVPWYSDNRRNIGYLFAVEQGATELLVVDDDNAVMKDVDCYECHVAGLRKKDKAAYVAPVNNWFNPCLMLKYNLAFAYPVYMRGYPFMKRFLDAYTLNNDGGGTVAVNVGLWTGSPDVDCLTHLMFPGLTARHLKSEWVKGVALSEGVYAPINTQNTCFLAEVLPAFYFWRMFRGMSWFGDVYAGLFLRHILDQLGYTVQYGWPLSLHIRGDRDEVEQLRNQAKTIQFHEELCQVIPSISLSAGGFADATLELIGKLGLWKWRVKWADWYIQRIARNMMVWVEACDNVM